MEQLDIEKEHASFVKWISSFDLDFGDDDPDDDWVVIVRSWAWAAWKARAKEELCRGLERKSDSVN